MSFRDLTVDNGLSQNSVVSIAQDSTGYMWFATQDGLNKYDGKIFTLYNKQFEDVTRPTYSKLGKTYVDKGGNLWIISNSGRLEKFDSTNGAFKWIKEINNASSIRQNFKKDYFIGTYGNGLFKIDHKTKNILQIFKKEFENVNIFYLLENDFKLYIATSTYLFQIDNDKISKIEFEKEVGNYSSLSVSNNKWIWVGTFGEGLFYKPENANKFKRFEHNQLPQNLIIQDLLVDKNDNLWIATYGNGLYFLDIKKNNIKHFVANKNDPYALHYDDVLCLYEDFSGIIWLGTDGAGLSYYDKHLKKFNVITNDQAPKNINVDVVRSIAVDKDKTMWLGTSGKGLTSIDSDSKVFKTYTHQNSKLSSDRIMSLLYHSGDLWIGHQGTGLQVMKSRSFIKTIDALTNQTIWKIYPNTSNQIWLCTRDSGLILFDKNHGIIKKIDSKNSALTTNNIRTIEKGNGNDFWIGTEDNGLFLLNIKSQKVEKIIPIRDKIKSLYFYDKTLWIGTNGNGLKAYNISKKTVEIYNKDNGLPNLVIYAILPGEQNSLWLSSNKGIFEFVPNRDKPQIEIYSDFSGLQAFEFNTGAYFRSVEGTLYFGGLEGVNWFNPSEITTNLESPKTVISKVELFGKDQKLIQNINYEYDQNTFTFTFAGLHFSQPEGNQYKYQLVNHDLDWVESGNNNVAHYTNLKPNTYTFKVKSSNYDGIWNDTPATYSFKILKPWYASGLAKTLYILAILSVIFAVYLYLKFRWEVKTQLRLEQAETERLKKLDEFKTKLYTNISHEFRTPLTLISGPIDHQLAKPDLKPDDRNELDLVKQNANRLLNLVNQMLDLSMIDSGQLRLHVSEGNLNVLLKQIVAAFQYKANEKRIHIFSNIKNLEHVWFDTDIIEKITSNLLTNAIKYAPEESDIILDANEQNGFMVLSIINVHSSLGKKDLGKLFQRFYQDDSSSDGVGVGLALVKELVSLSNGSILASNIDTNKLQFTVTIPIQKDAFKTSELKTNLPLENEVSLAQINTNSDRPLLLIVEDQSDIREFIISIFKDSYKIIQAENGETGIAKALDSMPDLIISDIMMPIKDGIELCNELKYNELTSHIPIILLTAKVGEENEIVGLRTGADAYITKPFNREKLKLRVEKLIENRRLLQKHFSKDFTISPDMEITSTEAEFLKRLKSVLDLHITDSEFSSEQFADAMLMSRTQLHRKLKAIVGMSSSEFMRSQRLKLSLPLLKQSDTTIAEIAYQVGFNTPSYFIKCFKETYGCTPNEYNSES
ncbi:MAG: response regulator [Winogradskyella sp.]|nr:response regulator [Winogradskyella sp.]